MFTGIVEHQGRVERLHPERWGARLVVDACGWQHEPSDGDSIAVDGCCLTVVQPQEPPARPGLLHFDVVHQTLGLTTMGALEPGRAVNLEHAATASTLMGGHIVQGHIDGVGRVRSIDMRDGQWLARIEVPASLRPWLIERGSIAVDGVSLTIAALGAEWFEVALIPATLAKTTLRDRTAGSAVNLEADCLAKMVAAQVKQAVAAALPRP